MAPQETAAGNLLVVDDDEPMRDFLALALGMLGYRVSGAVSAEDALRQLEASSFDVVITDLRMRGMGGIDLAREITARTEDVPVIVLTAFGDFSAAIEAIRAGAYDFFAKPVKVEVLDVALQRALQHRRLSQRVRALERSQEDARGFGELLGSSPPMLKLYNLLSRISDSDSSVLITGESGTGKEVVARALHQQGSRAPGAFVAVNCAALPEALLEAELFGHEKGAFTDAKSARAGLFVAANLGTLFLDEIGELPLALQAKLLRALQERVVRPLGGHRDVPFDVRLVCATNRNLEAAVEAGQFRSDLYFRINVIETRLPALRHRGNDVLVLAQHFLLSTAQRAKKGIVGFTPQAAEKLMCYSWPGNVRELQNAVERAVALAALDHIQVEDLPDRVKAQKRSPALPAEPSELVTLEEMEQRYILEVLQACGGNKSAAAKTLGLDRTTLWRKLEKYQLEAPDAPKP